jgi:microcystin-dependent protein
MKKLLLAATSLAGMALAMPAPAQAQEKYIGEVYAFAGNFCPRLSSLADGKLLPISQYTALFSILGTMYGGDGRTTFALPDLRGRSIVGPGTGPGLSTMTIGQRSGRENVTLTIAEMPQHNHDARVRASTLGPNTNSPAGASFPTFPEGTNQYVNGYDNITMANDEVQVARVGGSQAFNIRNPYLVLQHCVVLSGIFPPRN